MEACKILLCKRLQVQWQIQGFPEGEAPTPKVRVRALSYYLAKILHENERNWTEGERVTCTLLDPPLMFASTYWNLWDSGSIARLLRIRNHPDACMMSQFPVMPQFMMHETTNQIIQTSGLCSAWNW